MPGSQRVAPITQAVASVLRGAYITRGLTQEELVRRTGITPGTMQRIMAGRTTISVESMYAIAAAIRWKTAGEYFAEASRLIDS